MKGLALGRFNSGNTGRPGFPSLLVSPVLDLSAFSGDLNFIGFVLSFLCASPLLPPDWEPFPSEMLSLYHADTRLAP